MIVWLVGVGNLGSALAAALLDSGVVGRSELTLIERDASRHEPLRVRFGCRVVSCPPAHEELTEGGIAVLAVKPQDAASACGLLKPHLSSSSILLSVLAGTRTDTLVEYIGLPGRVVRCMPNLGAIVRESATGYYAPSEMPQSDLDLVHSVIASFGRAWRFPEETLLDVVTAVSGSGPAYVCWLAEQMCRVAVDLGVDAEVARELVLQTLVGTASYMKHESISFSDLRARVTSPNGTTAAAISALSERKAEDTLRAAIHKAFERAVDLSR